MSLRVAYDTCLLCAVALAAAGVALSAPINAHADAASDLQAQIDAHNAHIQALEAEIASYQKQVDALGAKKNTLQSTIDALTLSQKQLDAQISVTQNKIGSANLKISQLSLSIGDKESLIATDKAAVANALRTIAASDSTPLFLQLVSSETLGDAWSAVDASDQLNRALAQNVLALAAARESLASNRDQTAAAKATLLALESDLATQLKSVAANKATQQTLLSQTKNQESSYQKLIAEKKASEAAFEAELVSLQSQLDLVVNPTALPKVGIGLLSWPFSLAFMQNCAKREAVFDNTHCITQYFGNTPFSTQNPQVYNGHGHNAIDIAAPIGTPVHAALSGVIYATGNTDLVKGCYSFGKWVMIDHGNGLNTMYAHLSEIDVSKGQKVSTGDVIGLSGMTGYATGPHLHFGVYASSGTEIMTLRQFRGATIGCADATMPVATLDAYLNPLSYL
jgi:murein DD-endopeptidase MepM/ murein hydrolase activator NlpD